jgi:hypothetical protein
MSNDKIDAAEVREPEEAIAIAKYLLELIQQDLNMGRKETISPRLTKAIEALVNLQNIFPAIEPPPVVISMEAAKEYYEAGGYTLELPKTIGLYRVATKSNNWYLNYVAITMNDYRQFYVHDDIGVADVANYSMKRGGEECYWMKIS